MTLSVFRVKLPAMYANTDGYLAVRIFPMPRRWFRSPICPIGAGVYWTKHEQFAFPFHSLEEAKDGLIGVPFIGDTLIQELEFDSNILERMEMVGGKISVPALWKHQVEAFERSKDTPGVAVSAGATTVGSIIAEAKRTIASTLLELLDSRGSAMITLN